MLDTSSAQMATLASLRTGSMIVDVLIAMLIPMVFRSLVDGHAKQHLEASASGPPACSA
jgi:hypothetical protein